MLLTLLLALQVVSATQVENVERAAPAVRAQFDEELLDYPSARFRDVFVTRNPIAEAERGAAGPGYLCGYVNSKNAMGGYVGWRRFFAMGDLLEIEGEAQANLTLSSACGPRSVNDGVDRSAWVRHR